MEDAELVGGVLVDAPDLHAAANVLAGFLGGPQSDQAAAIAHGLDPHLVDVLRVRYGGDPARARYLCDLGAAWVLGRRSVNAAEPWDLVASVPSEIPLPPGLRRTTGETLVRLVSQSTRTLYLAAPFIDWPGMSLLADALSAATARGVKLQIFLPVRSTHGHRALAELEVIIRSEGDVANYSVAALRDDAPWAHLKVLSSDSVAAYLGSANITGAGISGPNLELGVFVRGHAVGVIEHLLESFREV